MTETTETHDTQAQEAAPIDAAATIAELEAKVAHFEDEYRRALAEQENIRRRTQRDKDDAVKYAAANFAKDLVSTADNLRRALESVKDTATLDEVTRNLLAGVEATERELLGAFERHGLKRLYPAGERFDHNLHQAIFELENTGHPAGVVAQVLQAGWVMGDRLLRPAMVGVAKAGPAEPAGEAPQRLDTTA